MYALKNIQCHAHRSGDGWEAFCPAFDIAVQGGTFLEVRAVLEDAINTYVETAIAEPEPSRSRLLARRAPWYMRLAWAWRGLSAVLCSSAADRDGHAGITFTACLNMHVRDLISSPGAIGRENPMTRRRSPPAP